MVGRGEKGLLIITGSFTKDAQKEANRDVKQRMEEDVVVQPDFFSEYE